MQAMSGKSHKPLFDLIGDPRASSAPAMRPGQVPRAEKPMVRVELKPMGGERAAPALLDKVSAGTGASPTPRAPAGPMIADRFRSMMGDSTVVLPRNAVLWSIALLIVLGLAIWYGGIKYGASLENAKWSKFTGDQPAPPKTGSIIDPLGGGSQPPAQAETPQGPSSASLSGGSQPAPLKLPQNNPPIFNPAPPPQPEREPTPAVGTRLSRDDIRAVLVPAGWVLEDPRQGGLNYLKLDTVGVDEAEKAVAYFHQNGVDVFGVQVEVERRGKGGKNAGPPERKVQLYALQGVSADLLKTSVCQNLETRVAALGQAWLREFRGSTNFGRPQWTKYSP